MWTNVENTSDKRHRRRAASPNGLPSPPETGRIRSSATRPTPGSGQATLGGCLHVQGDRRRHVGMQADVDLVTPHAPDGLLEMDGPAVHGFPHLPLDLLGQVLRGDAPEQLSFLSGSM